MVNVLCCDPTYVRFSFILIIIFMFNKTWRVISYCANSCFIIQVFNEKTGEIINNFFLENFCDPQKSIPRNEYSIVK